jgi:hypothetical protein
LDWIDDFLEESDDTYEIYGDVVLKYLPLDEITREGNDGLLRDRMEEDEEDDEDEDEDWDEEEIEQDLIKESI